MVQYPLQTMSQCAKVTISTSKMCMLPINKLILLPLDSWFKSRKWPGIEKKHGLMIKYDDSNLPVEVAHNGWW